MLEAEQETPVEEGGQGAWPEPARNPLPQITGGPLRTRGGTPRNVLVTFFLNIANYPGGLFRDTSESLQGSQLCLQQN